MELSILVGHTRCPTAIFIADPNTALIAKDFIIIPSCRLLLQRRRLGRRRNVSRETIWLLKGRAPYAALQAAKAPTIVRPARVLGMTKKGVAAYRKANPGSKLKTAVTGKVKKGSAAAKRRKSYCARSLGQLKRSSAKTRNNPNSRIRQARRRWKC